MIKTTGIQTKQGFIKYIKYKGFTLVPKLEVNTSDLGGLQNVMKRDGRIVYALPGGGEYVFKL